MNYNYNPCEHKILKLIKILHNFISVHSVLFDGKWQLLILFFLFVSIIWEKQTDKKNKKHPARTNRHNKDEHIVKYS